MRSGFPDRIFFVLFSDCQFHDAVRSRRLFAQAQRHARLVLREGDRAFVGEAYRLPDAFVPDGHEQLFVGPVENVYL